MTIQQNISSYQAALTCVENHCMATSVERSGGKVIIWYPMGFYPNGCRVDDTARGLAQAVEVMERHWMESFPSGNGMKNNSD